MSAPPSIDSKIRQIVELSAQLFVESYNTKRSGVGYQGRLSIPDENWFNDVYNTYLSIRDTHKKCFNSDALPIRLDEHKVIASVMLSILKIGFPVKNITGHFDIMLHGRLHFAYYGNFFRTHYREYSERENDILYRIMSEEDIEYPETITGSHKYFTQFLISLYHIKDIYSKGDSDLTRSMLFLSNIIFFIDFHNQSHHQPQN